MQSCHFHSQDMKAGHSDTQAHMFVHVTALTQSYNYEFDIFDAVNFATHVCILQNVLLNFVHFIMRFEILKMMYNLIVFFKSFYMLSAIYI